MSYSLEKAPKGTEFAGKRYREYHSLTGSVIRSRFTNSNIVFIIEVVTVMQQFEEEKTISKNNLIANRQYV